MTMQVIGTGVGRTGTYSLKLAINRLGFGPCHHMDEVLFNMPAQVPLWWNAVAGKQDWSRIYDGYRSAVDWPTAGFFRELYAEFPSAKYILTTRDADRWADSFGGTIYELLAGRGQAPEDKRDWLDMANAVIEKTGFPAGLDRNGLMDAFTAHCDAVIKTIPARQLLVFQVRDGWGPLCEFLDVPVPDEPFPRTNHQEEFWDRVNGNL